MGKIILGIIFSFLGLLVTWDAITTINPTARLGGFFIALVLLIIGVPLIIKGSKGSISDNGKKDWICPSCSNLIWKSIVICPTCHQRKPPDTKKCPFCAEIIKSEAIICRFCGKELSKDG